MSVLNYPYKKPEDYREFEKLCIQILTQEIPGLEFPLTQLGSYNKIGKRSPDQED